MLMTVLESQVASDKWAVLQQAFEDAGRNLPKQIEQSYLNQAESDPTIWQITTVWRSREDLEEYRKSVKVPGGVLMFRAAGAEPTLSIFNIRVQSKGMQ